MTAHEITNSAKVNKHCFFRKAASDEDKSSSAEQAGGNYFNSNGKDSHDSKYYTESFSHHNFNESTDPYIVWDQEASHGSTKTG